MSIRVGFLFVLATSVFVCCARRESATPPPPTVTKYTVADFYKNTEYGGASFSADAKKILVSSNRSGIWNAYAIPVAGGEPEPLTRSATDSIFAATYFPNDDHFLYTSDQGGNELSHVYVANPDGTTKDLTPGQNLNASFFGWAHDDKSFFVQSNERDKRFFDLYEYAANGYRRTLFYRNVDGFDAAAISRDKRIEGRWTAMSSLNAL